MSITLIRLHFLGKTTDYNLLAATSGVNVGKGNTTITTVFISHPAKKTPEYRNKHYLILFIQNLSGRCREIQMEF